MIEQIIGQTLAGKYRIEQLLREDAFGNTYRATHVLMEKPVAIKILNPALTADHAVVADFEREAKLLSRLAHPHVLGVTDYGTDENNLMFIVMENFDGRTLKDVIQAEGALNLPRAVAILNQVADALGAAHEAGIIHGAVSGDNILLVRNSARDWVKVIGFEASENSRMANAFDRNGENENASAVAYLSPEQCANSAQADFRSDVYSLGIVLFETLTGRLPFAGATASEIMAKHAHDIPPSLLAIRPDLPPSLEQIVQRSLAKKPAQRFQTAQEFTEALARAADNAPVATAWREDDTFIRPRGETATESIGDSRWRTAFIVLAGISLLSACLFFFTQNRRTTPITDPNSSPVQPINPATGAPEQNLSTDLMNPQFNTGFDPNITTVPPGGGAAPMPEIPYGGRIPPGIYQNNLPQGYVDPNSTSPFMGNIDAPVPTPIPKATPKPSATPAAAASPAVSPVPGSSPPKPAEQPSPATSPRTTPPPRATPAAPPANRNPVPKPTKEATEKSAQDLSSRISD